MKRVCPETIAGGANSPFRSCFEKTVVNRGNCLDENTAGAIMSWTAAPVLSADGFELRARRDHLAGVAATDSPGATDPLAAYISGDWITISLHVLQYDKKYRGLLLHADDATGNKVGEWGLPEMNDSPFWHPPVCGPKTVLHSGAAVKSLTSRFRFKAPPAGTGSITFKALIKVGPANTGEFYRPLDLVLPEAIASGGSDSDSGTWIVGLAGASCDETCRRHGAVNNGTTTTTTTTPEDQHTCDETVMFAGLKTPAATAAALSPVYPCNGPLLIDCGDPFVPATTTVVARRRCWYQDGMCGSAADSNDDNTVVTGRELCATNTSVSMRRFCACKAPSSSRRQRVLRVQKRTVAVVTSSSQHDNHHAEREAEAADRRSALQKAATSVWEKGTGDILHGTASHENWRPSGEFWYNPMTGATSTRRPMGADEVNDEANDEVNDEANVEEVDVQTDKVGSSEEKVERGIGLNDGLDDGLGDSLDNSLVDDDLANDLANNNNLIDNNLNDNVNLLALSSGARSPSQPKILLLLLPPMMMMHYHHRGGGLSFMTMVLLLTVVAPYFCLFASAHNWLQTPRRGAHAATTPSIATARPCGARSPSDIHYQVGAGQKFAVKFSAGHSSRYSFLVMPGSETDWLQHPDIMDMADDYVANAPAGTNKANVKGFRRIRDAAPDGTFRLLTSKGSPTYLPKRIWDQVKNGNANHHPEWIEHPDYPNRETWIFADKYIDAKTEKNSAEPDYNVAYKSAKYPWLESVQSYFLSFHNAAGECVLLCSLF